MNFYGFVNFYCYKKDQTSTESICKYLIRNKKVSFNDVKRKLPDVKS